jgi:hypothetical protein
MNELEGKDLHDYWDNILDRRMPEQDEIERLIVVLKGFYFDHCRNEGTLDSTDHKQGIIEFWRSKRPYGNKDVPASIAFNLGWDYKRQLCYHALPKFIEKIAEDLHNKVLKELEDNISLYADF